jgi:hypothetical protein
MSFNLSKSTQCSWEIRVSWTLAADQYNGPPLFSVPYSYLIAPLSAVVSGDLRGPSGCVLQLFDRAQYAGQASILSQSCRNWGKVKGSGKIFMAEMD